MKIISKKLKNFTKNLNHLNKNYIFDLGMIIIIVVMVISLIKEKTIMNIDSSKISEGIVGEAILSEIPNYKPKIISEHIKLFSREENNFAIVPVNYFYSSHSGANFLFYIINIDTNDIIYMLEYPLSRYGYLITDINSITITDLNNDNLNDILISFEYTVGYGRLAGMPLPVYEVYFGVIYSPMFKFQVELNEKIDYEVSDNLRVTRNDTDSHENDYIPDENFVINFIKNNY